MDDIRDRLQSGLEGRYRLDRELGRGGSGIVFLAEDLKHDRKVAVKVLDPELGRSLGADRFLREIRIAAGLSHPHILALHDSGEADGLLYYVMPFIQGESLQARLDREHQLPIEDAVRIGTEVADALAHAHDHDLIHRDIKPGNILLQSGHAILMDFGIARGFGESGDEKLTATGMTLGTPTYMSPEQAMGDDVDFRSDIYSLGCVVYEMLAGGAPHAAPTAKVILARKLTESAPELTVIRDTIPSHVVRAVKKAMAKTPADRFQSAQDFSWALKGQGVDDSDEGSGEKILGLPRTAVLGVAAAAVVALGAWAWLGRSPGNGGTSAAAPPAQAEFTPLTSQPGIEDSPSLSPDGMWVVYAGDVEGNRDIFLQGVGGRLPINLTQDYAEDDYQPAFAADGERIAFRSERDGGGIFTMGRTGEAVRRLSRAGFNPSWSPDGTRIVFATESVGVMPLNWEGVSELWIADVASGETRRVHDGNATQPAWSPDGRWIAFTARTRNPTEMDIQLLPVDGGEPVPITTLESHDWSPTWSPDGRYIYFVSDRGGTMNLWRVPVDPGSGRTTGSVEPVPAPGSSVAHPSVAGDGSLVAFSSVLHTMNVERASLDWRGGAMGNPDPLTRGSRRWANPDPTGDGSLVVFYSQDLPEGDLYVVRGDGTGLRQVTGDSAVDRVPRFSPDGSRIAYFSTRSGGFEVWITRSDGSESRQATPDGTSASVMAWSPDGSRIAANQGLDENRTSVVIFETDAEWDEASLERLPPPDSSITRFVVTDWSPDGATLAGMDGYSDSGIFLYSFESGQYERISEFGQWPAWLPDNRHLLFVTGGTEFHVVDRETGETRLLYSAPRDVLGPPRVTDDGSMVVFSRRATEGDIWLARLR